MNAASFTVGLLLILEALSAFVAAFLIYVAGLVIADEQRHGVPRAMASSITRGVAFLLLVASTLFLAHLAGRSGGMVLAALTLLGMLLPCAGFYFLLVRSHWEDDRILYTVLLWTAFWILISVLLLFTSWVMNEGAKFEVSTIDAPSLAQYVATIAQLAGILIAATMVVVTNGHNARQSDETARQQIYQTLELESVQLFRFECANADLVKMFWFDDQRTREALEHLAKEEDSNRDFTKVPVDMRVELYRLKEYTCQTLNLFEMACKFRKQDVISPDIFGSWVIWMWEISGAPMFRPQWEGRKCIEFNYIGELRDIMNAGIHYHREGKSRKDEAAAMKAFYGFVAHQMFPNSEDKQRAIVAQWLEDPRDEPPDYEKHWPKTSGTSADQNAKLA